MLETFDIYGIQIEYEDFLEEIQNSGTLTYDIGTFDEGVQRFKSAFLQSELYEILMKNTDLDIYFCEMVFSHEELETGIEMGFVNIGRNWSTIKDHETGKSFKENVEEELSNCFDFISDEYLWYSNFKGIYER